MHEQAPLVMNQNQEIISVEELRISGVDVASFLSRIRGDLRFMHSLLQFFVAGALETATQLPELIAQKEYTELQRQVHTLKGNAGNCSAEQVHALCLRMEAELSAQPTQAVLLDLTQALEREIRQIQASVAQIQILEPPSTEASPPLKTEELQTQIEQLLQALELSDMAALEFFATLKPHLSESSDCLTAIDKALERLDFVTALELLKPIQSRINEADGCA